MKPRSPLNQKVFDLQYHLSEARIELEECKQKSEQYKQELERKVQILLDGLQSIVNGQSLGEATWAVNIATSTLKSYTENKI